MPQYGTNYAYVRVYGPVPGSVVLLSMRIRMRRLSLAATSTLIMHMYVYNMAI